MRHACWVNPIPDICPLLLRNLDIVSLLQAGDRLTEDEATRRGALTTAKMSFGDGPATEDFVGQVRSLVAENLTGLRFDEDLLVWAMSPVLKGDRFREAVDILKSWRFSGTVRLNQPPDQRAPTAWLVIEAEDAFIDLLMQPLSLLSDVIVQMYGLWNTMLSKGLDVHPNLSVRDGTLAALEIFVYSSLGFPTEPITDPYANTRAGASTLHEIRTEDHAAKSLTRDLGFVTVPAGTPFPWEENADALIDETCKLYTLAHPTLEDEALHIDPYYGHAYHSSVLQNNEGIYLPWRTPEEGLPVKDIILPPPNHGWLSVPFRRVPRYWVTSAQELAQLFTVVRDSYAAAPEDYKSAGMPVLLRGQTREYLLSRPTDARRVLYADPDAREPALLASATRRSTTPSAFHAFAALVQFHLLNSHGPVADDEVTVFTHGRGDLIKVAYAQHYGLATDALDWTTDLLVAAWFALTQLTSAPDGKLTSSPVQPDAEAVIYCLRPENGHATDVRLDGIPAARPNAQHGWVTTASWGLRLNRPASYLLCAIYMPGAVRRELASSLPTQQQLFPTATQDPFVAVVKRWCDAIPHSLISQQLHKDLYEL